MIVPKTKDGRVVFMLPWLDQTIAGTTDSSTEITMRPQVGASLSVWAPGRMPQAFGLLGGPYSTWGCLLWVRSIVAGPAAAEQQQAGALHNPRCASTLRPQAHARAACQGKSYWVLACLLRHPVPPPHVCIKRPAC